MASIVCRFKGDLAKKRWVVFLRGVDTLMHTMVVVLVIKMVSRAWKTDCTDIMLEGIPNNSTVIYRVQTAKRLFVDDGGDLNFELNHSNRKIKT